MATVLVGKSDTGGGAWASLDVGVYEATLQSFESAPSAFEPDKERFQFNYELAEKDDDGQPIVMRYWANAVLSPRSSLAAVIEAHGFAWEVGKGFDLDTLIGTSARLMVGRKTPQGKTDEISFVQSVVPMAKGGGKTATKAAKAPAAAAAVDTTAAADEKCAVEGCVGLVDKYTKKGTPLCAEHEPDDL